MNLLRPEMWHALRRLFRRSIPRWLAKLPWIEFGGGVDKDQAWELVAVGWGNCVLKEEMKKIGAYPQKAWESFVSAHGIREHVFQQGIP